MPHRVLHRDEILPVIEQGGCKCPAQIVGGAFGNSGLALPHLEDMVHRLVSQPVVRQGVKPADTGEKGTRRLTRTWSTHTCSRCQLPAGRKASRSLLPFPVTRSARSSVTTSPIQRPTASERRSPHPSITASRAASRGPRLLRSASHAAKSWRISAAGSARPRGSRLPRRFRTARICWKLSTSISRSIQASFATPFSAAR